MTAQRQSNREQFPFAASKIDELRAVFGDGVKLTYACENGNTIGHSIEDKPGHWISARDMVIDPPRKETPPPAKGRRRG